MWPPSSSVPGADPDAAFGARAAAHDRARATPVPILVDAPTAAAVLSISERAFHSLRKRSDFPQNATVVLGPRCVRFHLEALHTFALSLVPVPQGDARQPRRSRSARPEKGAGADAKAL